MRNPTALQIIQGFPSSPAVTPDHKKLQARRADEIAQKLAAPGSVILGDPVGSGKTVVSLTAVRLLMNSGVRYGLLAAPNRTVASRWADAARHLGLKVVLPEAASRWKEGHLLITSTGKWTGPGKPSPSPSATVVVVDEAHRGMQNTEGAAYGHVRAAAAGARTLLVTATPWQIDPNRLIDMLRLPGEPVLLQHDLSAYGEAVKELMLCAVGPAQPDHASREQRKATAIGTLTTLQRPLMAALQKHMLSPFPATKMGVPPLTMSTRALVRVPPEWVRAYHVARLSPLLTLGTHGDMFNRRLDSSSEAFWAGLVGSNLQQREDLSSFVSALKGRLGEGENHPKVSATVAWATQRARVGRHVLVFCVWKETRKILGEVLARHLGPENVVAPEDDISDATIQRFRSPKGKPLVLVVQDRMSESIDLDGGRPCVVHHDLAWSPVRLVQRQGRVVRISSGFQRLKATDIYTPVLDVETDRRLFSTVQARRGFVALLCADADPESSPETGATGPWELPDDVFNAVRLSVEGTA